MQRSKASVQKLSLRYGINPKTVRKWRKRGSVEDAPMGPKDQRSTVLSSEEEAVIVAFRKHTLLPLDDRLYALQATIPHLTRSSLHRLFQRHGISRLPSVEGEKSKKRFRDYPIGYVHIDIAEVRTEDGTRFTTPGNTHSAASDIRTALTAGELFRAHAFEYACAKADIDHRLTKPNHPWTNGQVERMNRTIKEATVRRYFYDSHDRLREHLDLFLRAYNFAKRLKSLKGLTPYEHICKVRTEQPKRFRLDPIRHMPGLNT
ncbi:integrase core domain-containing protein [Thalassobaculum sp.]|uniref:integrase core domain-containing protein n=1 Tax=Thalassobaculum sp. TaxID=2022740 RepID=UPI0032EDC04E